MNDKKGNMEWLNDYPALKQVNQNNPFIVPEGYFDKIEQQILSYIKLDELKTTDGLNGFTTHENYFDELSDNINARINIEEALNKQADSFTVPEGYFEGLSEHIQSRIAVDEALTQSDAAYAVPQGYFDKLNENILSKTIHQEDVVKSISSNQRGIVRQLFSSTAFKYATAACFTLVVGTAIFLTKTNTLENHNDSYLHKSLAEIPTDDIRSYLQLHLDAADTHSLIDASKQVNTDNLNDDLQDELDQ